MFEIIKYPGGIILGNQSWDHSFRRTAKEHQSQRLECRIKKVAVLMSTVLMLHIIWPDFKCFLCSHLSYEKHFLIL